MPKVPKVILDRYNNVTLCYDLMHVNVIKFLNTTSCHIIFATVSMIKTQKMNSIEEGIKQFENCAYSVASRSPAYIIIANLNHYVWKWLIFASTSIKFSRSNVFQIFNGSIGPPRNVSDLPKLLCLSHRFQNQ